MIKYTVNLDLKKPSNINKIDNLISAIENTLSDIRENPEFKDTGKTKLPETSEIKALKELQDSLIKEKSKLLVIKSAFDTAFNSIHNEIKLTKKDSLNTKKIKENIKIIDELLAEYNINNAVRPEFQKKEWRSFLQKGTDYYDILHSIKHKLLINLDFIQDFTSFLEFLGSDMSSGVLDNPSTETVNKRINLITELLDSNQISKPDKPVFHRPEYKPFLLKGLPARQILNDLKSNLSNFTSTKIFNQILDSIAAQNPALLKKKELKNKISEITDLMSDKPQHPALINKPEFKNFSAKNTLLIQKASDLKATLNKALFLFIINDIMESLTEISLEDLPVNQLGSNINTINDILSDHPNHPDLSYSQEFVGFLSKGTKHFSKLSDLKNSFIRRKKKIEELNNPETFHTAFNDLLTELNIVITSNNTINHIEDNSTLRSHNILNKKIKIIRAFTANDHSAKNKGFGLVLNNFPSEKRTLYNILNNLEEMLFPIEFKDLQKSISAKIRQGHDKQIIAYFSHKKTASFKKYENLLNSTEKTIINFQDKFQELLNKHNTTEEIKVDHASLDILLENIRQKKYIFSKINESIESLKNNDSPEAEKAEKDLLLLKDYLSELIYSFEKSTIGEAESQVDDDLLEASVELIKNPFGKIIAGSSSENKIDKSQNPFYSRILESYPSLNPEEYHQLLANIKKESDNLPAVTSDFISN
ncbi:MAG: hypothetical protein GY730_08475 [bacterium]|nr:hypothetical protein [bacterium]